MPLIASKIATWTIAIAREANGGLAEVLRTAASNIMLQSLTTSVVPIIGRVVGLDVGLRVVGFVVGLCVVGLVVVGELVVGESVVGESVVGESVVGKSVVGKSVVGELVVGESVVGSLVGI
jgi:hypothetical protein